MNILDYIDWRGDLSFKVDSFNDVDALVLSQLSYLDFSDLIEGDKSVPLRSLALLFREAKNYEQRSDLGLLINKSTIDLLLKAATSVRFSDVLVSDYVQKMNTMQGVPEQFAAVTFSIQKNLLFVAFRGTDDTIAGWKEDFLLATETAVPAQKDALDYLTKAIDTKKGDFLVGGHSKGGNLAIYAAANLATKSQKKVARVYNMDGPGFPKQVLSSAPFKNIEEMVVSFYPKCSVVGMLFYHMDAMAIIESDEVALMQHDPFSWHILANKFVTVDGFDSTSVFFHDTFNTWVDGISREQLRLFTDTLFTVIEATDATTNSEIEKNAIASSVKIVKAISLLDKETRTMVLEVTRHLFDVASLSLQSRLPPNIKKIFLENDKAK